MVPLWWSVLLTSVGVLGIWLAGQRNYWGWALGVGAQALWIAYAVATEQWGFIASALAYGFVYARALHRWRRDDQTSEVR
jgi:nicotinamide riboside transporter PnuC